MMTRDRQVIVACAALLVCVVAPSAEQGERPQQPAFRAGVELVQLDVSVADGDRRPVRGLTASDFTVLIDGRREPVVAFKAVDLSPAPPPPAAAWVRDVAPEVVNNARPSGRVIAILIDDYSFSEAAIDVGGVRKARDTALAVLNDLGPDDKAAVLFTGYARTAQAFTSNRALLRDAIEKAPLFGSDLTPDASAARGFCYCGVCSIDALGRISESLRSLPEQRKILVYISAGSYTEIQRRGADECLQRKRDAMHDSIRQAHLANVTIQAVDPKGVVTFRGRDAARGGVIGVPMPANPLEEIAKLRQEFLRTMAETTGGRAVVNNNNMDVQVPSLLAESSSYYLLGVERPAAREDGRLRRIEVRVNRRGISVRTRQGYFDPTREEIEVAAKMAASGDPSQAILGALPKATIPLDLAVAPFATVGGDGALAISLGVTATPDVEAPSRPLADDVEVLAELFNIETGQSAGVERQHVAVTWSRPEAGSGYYEVFSQLNAKPGRYELRVGLRADDGRTSGVYASVEIPEFDRDLSASGLILSAEPAAKSAPNDAFDDLLPANPTARRVFRATDRVNAFLRVYQNTRSFAATTVTTQLTDANNKVIADEVKALDGRSVLSGSAAGHSFVVPTWTLAPGEYLLTMQVESRGRTLQRTSRFRVQ
jgi:VWFA-related protein